jgi:hypothetical protein
VAIFTHSVPTNAESQFFQSRKQPEQIINDELNDDQCPVAKERKMIEPTQAFVAEHFRMESWIILATDTRCCWTLALPFSVVTPWCKSETSVQSSKLDTLLQGMRAGHCHFMEGSAFAIFQPTM